MYWGLSPKIDGHNHKASYDTRREEDIEFATDPNFFEQIFYVLTIVGTPITAPRKTHGY